MSKEFDVIIIGAGLSGIGGAYHLQKLCPNKRFVVLEGRENIGGTWDLFKYPGIRSDSSMETMGYTFRPWQGEKSISEGGAILSYIHSTAEEYNLKEKILCGHNVVKMNWISKSSRWSLDINVTTTDAGRSATPTKGRSSPRTTKKKSSSSMVQYSCQFLLLCTGYYDYASGYVPEFKDRSKFKGTIVHPQLWPKDLDYKDKRIAIIGSGATAVTLLPVLAETAAHVVMIQRSPSYIVSVPAVDPMVVFCRRIFPEFIANSVLRWWSVLIAIVMYWACRVFPTKMKNLLMHGVGIDTKKGRKFVEKHFSPKYNPWDQRLCIIPDGDFFHAIRDDKASIVTGKIARFTDHGVQMDEDSNNEIVDADIIVTATGLQMKVVGGIEVYLDDVKVDLSKQIMYKGVMVSNIPNAAVSVGYTNATWTLKCDLTFEYVCKLLNYMDEHQLHVCTANREAEADDDSLQPVFDLSSGYIQRAMKGLPKQGKSYPWKYNNNYIYDIMALRYGSILDEGVLSFK